VATAATAPIVFRRVFTGFSSYVGYQRKGINQMI